MKENVVNVYYIYNNNYFIKLRKAKLGLKNGFKELVNEDFFLIFSAFFYKHEQLNYIDDHRNW